MTQPTLAVVGPPPGGGPGDPAPNGFGSGDPAGSGIPDLEPYGAEPFLLGRLATRQVGTGTVALVSTLLTVGTATYEAAVTQTLYRAKGHSRWYQDVWAFLSHGHVNHAEGTLPLLRDYPSMLLALCIATSVPLVFGLFKNLAVLHTDLDRYECISADADNRKELATAIVTLNGRLKRIGRLAPLVVVLIAVSLTVVNVSLGGHLSLFAGEGDLYDTWWARADGLRPGGVVWIAFGTVGAYMIYAEAVVGITYVAFLRRLGGEFRFRANSLNPDGFYGWSRIRKIVTNMEAGVVSSTVTAFGLYFFLLPVVGVAVTVALLAGLLGVVFYVFIGSNVNLRRQVAEDRITELTTIIEALGGRRLPADAPEAAVHQVLLTRRDLASRVPTMPIRKGLLFFGLVPAVAGVAALAVQLLAYFG